MRWSIFLVVNPAGILFSQWVCCMALRKHALRLFTSDLRLSAIEEAEWGFAGVDCLPEGWEAEIPEWLKRSKGHWFSQRHQESSF